MDPYERAIIWDRARKTPQEYFTLTVAFWEKENTQLTRRTVDLGLKTATNIHMDFNYRMFYECLNYHKMFKYPLSHLSNCSNH